MIPSFFESEDRIVSLRAAAASVLHTPFFPNSEAPGRDGGMDCVHLMNWVYRTCGVIGRIDIPPQVMDAGQHSEHSLLIEAFETWPGVRERFVRLPSIEIGQLLPGDALCFTAGKVPHHGGILLPADDVLHTLLKPGAHTMRVDAVIRGERLIGRLAAAFRPLPLL